MNKPIKPRRLEVNGVHKEDRFTIESLMRNIDIAKKLKLPQTELSLKSELRKHGTNYLREIQKETGEQNRVLEKLRR